MRRKSKPGTTSRSGRRWAVCKPSLMPPAAMTERPATPTIRKSNRIRVFFSSAWDSRSATSKESLMPSSSEPRHPGYASMEIFKIRHDSCDLARLA